MASVTLTDNVDIVIDKDRLCHLVAENELLYNKDHRQYKNKIKVSAAWKEIATKLGISGI